MSSDSSIPAGHVGKTISLNPGVLNPFHRNPRRGDVDAIAGSLKANGQFKPIVVNRGTHTGRPDEVLAGNHTLAAILQLREQNPFEPNWNRVLVHVLDVDEDMANRIVLVDNRSFEMGEGTDDQVAFELLNTIGTTGTGYTDAELDALDAALTPTVAPDPAEIPEDPETPDLPPHEAAAIGFTIPFDDEDQQNLWFEFLKALRDRYPDEETVAERLIAHLTATESERV